jgi:hypothetical protein
MATKYNAIVADLMARTPVLANNNEYLSTMRMVPIFIDASVQLVNNTDVVYLTLPDHPLPAGTKAVAIALCTDGTDGAGANTTAAIKAGSTVLTTSATIGTLTDNNGELKVYSLQNIDVSGKSITLTVGGADWSDATDMFGYLLLAMSI